MTSPLVDQDRFSELTTRYRRELEAHCYRMLGSAADAEDLVQETFLRAWEMRASFEGRSSFRAWLYRIATNASLDALERRRRQVPVPDEHDSLFERIRATDAEPDEAVVSKETIESAFMIAIEHLTPKQRAVLTLRCALGWSARDAAALLEASVASVNSALQRARLTMRARLSEPRLEWTWAADPSAEQRTLLDRYIEVVEAR